MFESLDDHMKHDRQVERSKRERVIVPLAIVVLSVILFVGLYLGVRLLE